MHNIDLILTLTAGFIAAVTMGYITQRIGLSPIVGYLLAGVALSPHTPGFVAHAGMAEQLAEIGVILLMFGVGLQFHFKELLAVRRIAVPGAVVQSLVATVLGAVVIGPAESARAGSHSRASAASSRSRVTAMSDTRSGRIESQRACRARASAGTSSARAAAVSVVLIGFAMRA